MVDAFNNIGVTASSGGAAAQGGFQLAPRERHPLRPDFLGALSGTSLDQMGLEGRQQLFADIRSQFEDWRNQTGQWRDANSWRQRRLGALSGQPNNPQPVPGQPPVQTLPAPVGAPIPATNPAGFAPPGMAGSSYLVRGMNPGATPFDLPTY